MTPTSADAGSSGFLLTVGGQNFLPTSTIEWDGIALPTVYLSDTQLETQVPAADLLGSGFAAVAVLNPAPGGGISSGLPFSINYTPTIFSQSANDLVWDPLHQVMYLSVPSLAPSNGNSVVAFNPVSGTVQSAQFAGSEPNKIAISADNQYLYAALDGSSSVQRFMLPSLTPDIRYSLGAVPFFGPTFGWDVQVAPGLPHTTAVSRGVFTTFPYSALGGLAIYDDAVVRPTIASTPGNLFDSLQWGSNTTIYANNAENTNFDFYVLTASPSGAVLSHDYPNVFSSFYMSIHYDPTTNRVYGDDGTVVNPANGQLTGVFGASGWMVPDPSTNTAYFLGQTAFQVGGADMTIESFDLTTFAPIAEIVIPNVLGNPVQFIRWGNNGLAFNDDTGQIYIINDTNFVSVNSPRLGAARRWLSTVQKTRSFPRIPRASKALPSTSAAYLRTRRGSRFRGTAAYAVVPNPAPSITSLSPNTVSAGVTALNGLTLTVLGNNFVSLSTIEWNGSARPTEFVSSTMLQAQIGLGDVINAGTASVDVITPGPGGGTSNSLPFTVLSNSSNHVPILTSLYPNAAPAGSPGFTLNINGYAYFTPATIVEWNGSPRPFTLYSSGQIQLQVTAADVATPGYAQITVINPGSGGGTATAEFQVLYQPTILNQLTNDMVWDQINKFIYISVPGASATYANQVCALNPVTAIVVSCQNAGIDPNVLAVSDDGQFLYVGEDGSNAVQRFILPGLTPDITYSLGKDPIDGPYVALDLQVAPGAPHTTAVSKGIPNLQPATEGGITIYDDGTPRPVTATGWGPTSNSYDSLQWGADSSTLYAANTEVSTMDFYTLSVDSSGVTLTNDYQGVFWNPGRIHYDRGNGLVYSDDGFHAVNPSTGLPEGIFELGGGWPMAPDSALNHVFMLDQYIFQSYSDYTITIFDMSHYVPMTRIPFSTAQGGINRLGRWIRWGSNGLAVNDMQGNLYLISGPFVN